MTAVISNFNRKPITSVIYKNSTKSQPKASLDIWNVVAKVSLKATFCPQFCLVTKDVSTVSHFSLLNCWHKCLASTLKCRWLYGSALFQGQRSKWSIHVVKLYLLCVESAGQAQHRGWIHRILFYSRVQQQDFSIAQRLVIVLWRMELENLPKCISWIFFFQLCNFNYCNS